MYKLVTLALWTAAMVAATRRHSSANRGSEGLPVDDAEPILIRNSRFALGLLFAAGLSCLLLTPCAIVIALASVYPFKHISFDGMYGLVAWAGGAYLFGRTGLFLFHHSSRMLHNHVLCTPDGVSFGIRSGEEDVEEFFAWNDIRAVTSRRVALIYVCTVQGSNGRAVYFDSYVFLRPKHIAYEITNGIRRHRGGDL